MNATHDTPRPGSTIVAIRTWLRYVVPLTVLSAIALSPVLAIALRTRAPVDPASVNALSTRGGQMIAVAVFCQLVLVGGASAIVRSRPSQLRAFGLGLTQLVRAIVPCLAAAAAIAIASLALIVPGLLLLPLLSLTAASSERGLPAPLVDSVAIARPQFARVALAVAAMLALDIAIMLLAQRALIAPLPRHATPAQLAALRPFLHVVALALVLASPVPTTILATRGWRR